MNFFWRVCFRWLVIFISVREETDMRWLFQCNIAGFTSNDLNCDSTLFCLMTPLCYIVLSGLLHVNNFCDIKQLILKRIGHSENISENLMTVKQYNPQRWQDILLIKPVKSFSMCRSAQGAEMSKWPSAQELFSYSKTDCWPTACEFKAPLRETRMSAEYVPAYLVSDEN